MLGVHSWLRFLVAKIGHAFVSSLHRSFSVTSTPDASVRMNFPEHGGFGLSCSSARGVNAAAAMISVVPHLKIPGMLEQERA